MTVPADSYKYAPIAIPVTVNGDATLSERFIATPVDKPSPEAQPYLEVAAPATLPEGYTFEANVNGHNFTVKVPVGGVEEGQTFSVPFPAGAIGYSGAAIPRASVPVGHWKDGLYDCCRYGPIHPVIWNAWCCPLVMHRLKLTWLGNEGGTIAQTTATFRTLLLITAVYYGTIQILNYTVSAYYDVVSLETFRVLYAAKRLLMLSFGIFTITLVAKTRKHIRSKYGIPEKQCAGCEDCCCSFWCNCCTVAQMARHTADYDTYAGLCCSETGTSPHAPSIV